MIARHAINTVQAHAYGAGFQTAAIFGAVAIALTLAGLGVASEQPADLISTR